MEYDIEEILYTFEDDYNPSSMVPGPRNMYAQGQLVQPNADGSRPGYNGRKNKKISYDKENKIIKEYNTYLSDEVKSGNMSKSLGFKSWLRENKTPTVFEKTYNAWSKKLLNVKPASVTDAKVGLLKTFVERANEQGQFVEKKKLLELIGRTQTPGVAEKNVYIENILKEINKLESREDKVYKAFNRLFNNELVFVTDPEFYKKFPSDKEAGSITRMLIQETGLTGPTIRKHRATWKKDGSKVPFFNTKKGKEQLSIIEHMNLKMGKVGEATFDGFNFNDLMEYGSNSKKGKMFYKSATGSDFYKDPNNVVRDFVVRHFDHNSKFGDKSKLIKVFKKGTNTEVKYEAGKRLIDFDFTYKGKRYGSNELAKEYLKWTRGENTPFSEVYNNHKSYTDFLRKPVNTGDPSVKNIGDLFKLAGHKGMAIEHGSLGGVAEEPFKNLKLLSSRANSELGTILQYYKKFPNVQKLLVDEFVKELPVNENYIDALAKNEIKIAKDMLKNGNTTIPMTYNQAAKNVLTNRNIKNFSPEELLTVSKSAFGPEIGYKTFVGVEPERFENINTKKQLTKMLADLGCPKSLQKASGGRIKYSKGTSCPTKGREIIEKGLKNGFKNKNQQVLAEGILKSGRFLKDAVSLRGLFGPAALAFTAAAEAGIVGYDMLASGKSFREAVGDSIFNYALGDKTKIDSDEEFMKRLKNIKVGPQGYQRMGEAEIGKMMAFKSALDDINYGGDLYKQLNTITENRKQIDSNPEDAFNQNAFQLDLDRQEDKVRADIRDFNKVGTPDKLLGVDYEGGAKATELANLLVKQDQLKDAGTAGVLPKIDEGVARNLKQTKYGIENLFKGPTGYEGAVPSEMSYIMSKIKNEPDNNYGLFGPAQLMEGGIASLNVNKK